jgi:hypothetical protein
MILYVELKVFHRRHLIQEVDLFYRDRASGSVGLELPPVAKYLPDSHGPTTGKLTDWLIICTKIRCLKLLRHLEEGISFAR